MLLGQYHLGVDIVMYKTPRLAFDQNFTVKESSDSSWEPYVCPKLLHPDRSRTHKKIPRNDTYYQSRLMSTSRSSCLEHGQVKYELRGPVNRTSGRHFVPPVTPWWPIQHFLKWPWDQHVTKQCTAELRSSHNKLSPCSLISFCSIFKQYHAKAPFKLYQLENLIQPALRRPLLSIWRIIVLTLVARKAFIDKLL